MAIGKVELVKIVSERTGAPQKQVSEFVNVLTEVIGENLARGNKVQITGFGTFLARKRESRVGRNPGTGDKINIPASLIPVFKPGKALKEKINFKA